MRKLSLLLVITLSLIFMKANAQVCTPMWTDTTSGISPDTIVNLPPAYINTPYSTVVQFKVPSTTTYQNQTINIDHIQLTGVAGLSSIPASVAFGYQCNPADCSFDADSVGCVLITGTPTTAGTYPLTINANVYLNQIIFVPFPTTGYKIVVNESSGISSVNTTRFDASANFPNPFSGTSSVYVNLVHAGNITLKISNLVGNEVYSQTIPGKKGVNEISIDATKFPSGIYFYSASNGTETITKRMVVDKK